MFKKILFLGILALFITIPVLIYKQKPAPTPKSVKLTSQDNYPDFLPFRSSTIVNLELKLPNFTANVNNYQPLFASGFHNEYLSSGDRLYMIQFKKPLSIENEMDLRPKYVFADNVYIVNASVEGLKNYTLDSSVNFVDHFHPHYKMDPKLVTAYYQLTLNSSTKFKVFYAKTSNMNEIKADLNKIPLQIVSFDEAAHTLIATNMQDRQQLFSLALNPAIIQIMLN